MQQDLQSRKFCLFPISIYDFSLGNATSVVRSSISKDLPISSLDLWFQSWQQDLGSIFHLYNSRDFWQASCHLFQWEPQRVLQIRHIALFRVFLALSLDSEASIPLLILGDWSIETSPNSIPNFQHSLCLELLVCPIPFFFTQYYIIITCPNLDWPNQCDVHSKGSIGLSISFRCSSQKEQILFKKWIVLKVIEWQIECSQPIKKKVEIVHI